MMDKAKMVRIPLNVIRLASSIEPLYPAVINAENRLAALVTCPRWIDPVRDKPRRSGRGRIARTA